MHVCDQFAASGRAFAYSTDFIFWGVRGKQEGGVRCLWEEPKGAATKRAGPSMQLWPGVPLSQGNGAGSETIDDQGGIGAMAWQA